MPKGFLGYYLKKNHEINIQKIRLVVRVRFAGLYDTVSSYGEIAGFIPQFANDIEELKLHEVSNEAKYVLHLTAKDEWRVNFALTQLKTTNCNHRELSLVGSHADVGDRILIMRMNENLYIGPQVIKTWKIE